MQKLIMVITGTAPLLMHNARLSDPIDPATKNLASVSKKRNKTEEDHLAVGRAEYIGGMYYDEEFGPYIPAANIEAAFKKCSYQTVKVAKDKLTAGFRVTSMVNPIAYDGPRDVEGLWGGGDSNFVSRASVKVGQSRVMRTRPMFPEWLTEVDAMYDENVVDLAQLEQIAEYAGAMIGIGDWRPRYGTFEIEIKEAK